MISFINTPPSSIRACGMNGPVKSLSPRTRRLLKSQRMMTESGNPLRVKSAMKRAEKSRGLVWEGIYPPASGFIPLQSKIATFDWLSAHCIDDYHHYHILALYSSKFIHDAADVNPSRGDILAYSACCRAAHSTYALAP